MKKTLLILPLTAALLAACGSAPIPVTLNTLTVGGVSNTLQISAPAKLAVTATGSDGNPFTGTATFTSSDPNIIAVAADGTLDVRHLSVAPVILTASEAGKTATVTVSTYGLDVAGGTYSYSNSPVPGSFFVMALRNADGSSVDTTTPVTIQGPAAFNNGAALNFDTKGATLNYYAFATLPKVQSVTGTYTATATVGGVVFSKTFSIDSAQLQPLASGVTLSLSQAGYTASGTLPAGSPLVFAAVYNTSAIGSTRALTTLPQSGTLPSPITPGQTYYYGVYAQNYNGPEGKTFPDQVNRSYNYDGQIVAQ